MSKWTPVLGANYIGYGTQFRLWAPDAGRVELLLEQPAHTSLHTMTNGASGHFEATIVDAMPGHLYSYRIDGKGPFPDPVSRFQPRGVHGPSEIIDPSVYAWTQPAVGIELEDVVLYELHVGTFTPDGTFAAAGERLPYLKDLGVTAVEVMPVADFAGDRNWGYDGVSLFAPARCYGRPDDLRAFVDEAHRLGLAVFLDVVYNHLGPDGAYHAQFSPYYLSQTHHSPWGAAINFDGPNSDGVRDFYIENALRWVHEYRIDGLRLDATHAIIDDSPRHILAELANAIRESIDAAQRKVQIVAEEERNLAHQLKPESEGGWGLDGVWADDFHHQVRRHVAGDRDGYYADYEGTAQAIAETARKGWFYCGQFAHHYGRHRGTDPAGIDLRRFFFCIQNHDQIGNRAFGDRLNHNVDLAQFRAASALFLFVPEVPLLFMGQEWAASSPFQYFTDHNDELGKLVTEGRRREFQKFAAFAHTEIPDPQQFQTFARSRLKWDEVAHEPHASVLRLYTDLIRLRRQRLNRQAEFEIDASGDAVVAARGNVAAVFCMRKEGVFELKERVFDAILCTEDACYTADPQPPVVQGDTVTFLRPGALIYRTEPEA